MTIISNNNTYKNNAVSKYDKNMINLNCNTNCMPSLHVHFQFGKYSAYRHCIVIHSCL